MEQLDIDKIIVGYLSGECSDEELLLFHRWMSASDENKKYYFHLKKIWNHADTSPDQINLDERWATTNKKVFGKTYSLNQLLRIASVIIVSIGLGIAVTWFVGTKSQQVRAVYNETVVPYGGQAEVKLSDGSTVKMNAGSKLKYPAIFNGPTRKVFLEGEAFFEVMTDREHPFIVSTSNLDVKATGTKFNVNAYKDEPVIIATLVEGRISIKPTRAEGDEIVLKPNQTITYYYNEKQEFTENEQNTQDKVAKKTAEPIKKAKPRKIDIITHESTEVYTSWKDNKWVIEKEKLESLAKRLERHFNVEIQFNAEKLKNFSFTGKLEDEPIEQVLQAMKLTAPLKYKIEGRKVYLILDTSVKNYEKLYSNY